MEAAVAAQLGLHAGQVGSPLAVVDASLVLLHPAQQVLDVAHGDLVQLGSQPHGGLLQERSLLQDRSLLHDLDRVDLSHGDLCRGHARLEPQVVFAAEVHQPLVQAINSGDRIQIKVGS